MGFAMSLKRCWLGETLSGFSEARISKALSHRRPHDPHLLDSLMKMLGSGMVESFDSSGQRVARLANTCDNRKGACPAPLRWVLINWYKAFSH